MKWLIAYFKESWRELQFVTWPNRQEAIKLTYAVILYSAIIALFIGILDFGLVKLIQRIIL